MSAEPVPVDLAPDKVAMRAHLDHLFGAVPPAFQDGLVEIAYTTPDGEIKYAQLFKLDALDDAVEFAAAVNGKEGFSVYVGAALRKPMKRKTGRCGEAEFYAALSLWADLDDEESVKAAGGKCSAAMPNFALYSGRYPHVRMQLFWRLAEPITSSKAMRPPLAAICTHLDGDEKVVEPARLMRLAGSIAWPHKPDRVAEMTGVLRIKTPLAPKLTPLQDLMAAYSTPGNVVNLAEIRKVTKPAAETLTTGEWGKLTDGREGAMRDFVWRWVVDLYRDAPIQPSETASREEMERAWAEFARTIAPKEPGHTLEDEGRGESMFASKWRYAMRQWDGKVRDAAQVPPPGDAPESIEEPEPAPLNVEPFKTVQASSFAGLPIPEQKYLDGRQTVPVGSVTLLTGSGGVGKTIVALMLAVACVARGTWLGYPVNENGRGVVIFYSGEEPIDVIHRHVANICLHEGIDLASLTGLHIIEAVEEEAGPGLFTQTKGKNGAVEPTKNFHRLRANVELLKPDLIIADNRGQIVEADENSRVVVHQTMTPLSRMARQGDSAFMLLAHPSMTGDQSGSGQSGSTAWYGTARSQLHMTRPKESDGKKEDMTSLERIIEVKKNQYDRTGSTINMVWEGGCYKCTDPAFQRAGFDTGRESKAENVFMHLTAMYNSQGLDLNASPSSPNYAPKLFSTHPKRDKLLFKDFDKALKILLEAGRVKLIPVGLPSRRQKQLVVCV